MPTEWYYAGWLTGSLLLLGPAVATTPRAQYGPFSVCRYVFPSENCRRSNGRPQTSSSLSLTALARAGIVFEKDKQLDLLNTRTGEINLAHAPDEIRFEVEQFNKHVVTTEFNRVVQYYTRSVSEVFTGYVLRDWP